MADAINSVTNGPVADKVKEQHLKTYNEFTNLAASRQVPNNPAATGQPLTHYHSFFSELLSWNNPRASAIAYVSTVAFFFAVRYLDLLRWGFKITWVVLGITVLAEAAGKAILNTGFASQLRPRRYYTVPRETLDTAIGDVHELVNFIVIETQRIVFAENIWASLTVAISAFVAYWLVKIVPYWGLGLIASTLLFSVPLLYTSNQELIDHHLKNAQGLVRAQTEQLRNVAGTHTAQATEATKQLVGDYTSKAQQILRGSTSSPEATHTKPAHAEPAVRESDFPAAPREDFSAAHQQEFPAAPQQDFSAHREPHNEFQSEREPAYRYEQAEHEPLN